MPATPTYFASRPTARPASTIDSSFRNRRLFGRLRVLAQPVAESLVQIMDGLAQVAWTDRWVEQTLPYEPVTEPLRKVLGDLAHLQVTLEHPQQTDEYGEVPGEDRVRRHLVVRSDHHLRLSHQPGRHKRGGDYVGHEPSNRIPMTESAHVVAPRKLVGIRRAAQPPYRLTGMLTGMPVHPWSRREPFAGDGC
jgi:hypothetical protein